MGLSAILAAVLPGLIEKLIDFLKGEDFKKLIDALIVKLEEFLAQFEEKKE